MPKLSANKKRLINHANNTLKNAKKQRISEGIKVTTSQLIEWKTSLNNHSGRTRSSWENCLIIQEICYYMLNGKTNNEIYNILVDIHGGRIDTYKNIWSTWINDSSTDLLSNQNRGRPPFDNELIDNISPDKEEKIAKFIFDNTIAEPTGFSGPDFERFLNENLDMKVNEYQSKIILKKYNCIFDDQPKYYGFDTPDRIKDLTRFLECYSHALKLERDGTHVIVYQDETWANIGTCMKESYRHDCNHDYICENFGICHYLMKLGGENWIKARVSQRDSGKRVAVSYAHTKDGILGNSLDHSNQLDFSTSHPTSELLFECNNSTDYHQEFNAEMYETYIKYRLIPAFKQKYGNDMKMILLIDQAPYHSRRNDFPSQSDSKSSIKVYYQNHGINKIKLKRITDFEEIFIEFDISQFEDRAPKGPYKEEMLLYLFEYLKKTKPESLETVVSTIVKNHNGYVLYTVPNNPKDQPHEFCNAHLKYFVRKNCNKGRTIDKLMQDIQCGVYGGTAKNGYNHKPVDSIIVSGWRSKCIENMNIEIKDHMKIDDNIYNLHTNISSKAKIGDSYVHTPWTTKTLKKWQKSFETIIE
jgi:hypothetical protein